MTRERMEARAPARARAGATLAAALAGALALAGCDRGPETPVEVAEPSTVGMDPAGLARIDSIVEAAIADSAFPGAAVAVGRHGRLVRLRGYGRLDWDRGSGRVNEASIYDLASLTKVVGTTSAVMRLVGEGRLALNDRIGDYLPWWAAGDPRKLRVTVGDLLVHQGGLPPFRRFYTRLSGREAYRNAIGGLSLAYPPGDSTVYSDIGLMTLAFVVEEITGAGLDDYLRSTLWTPLGMQDTGFRPDSSLLPRIAPTEVDTLLDRGHVRGVVHDENAFAMGGVAGHAGLFSSARDLAVFAQMMLNGGSVRPCPADGRPCSAPRSSGVAVLPGSLIERFTARADTASSRALGWDTPHPGSAAGRYLTSDAFGHTGFTGTSLWIDPELDLFVVLLANRVNPTRENRKHLPVRRAVVDAAATAITDAEVTMREWAR